MSARSFNYNSANLNTNVPVWTQRYDCSNVTLTSGVAVNILSLPSSSIQNSLYCVRLYLEVKGDNTTNITVMNVRLGSVTGGSYQITPDTLLLNTTLPNTNAISFSRTLLFGFFDNFPPNVVITSTFTGTAPIIQNAFVRLIRIY